MHCPTSGPAANQAPGPLTVSEVIDRYLQHGELVDLWSAESMYERQCVLGLFREAYGNRPVVECRAFHLTDWIEAHPSWRSSSTRKAKANQVCACFNWALKQGRIDKNPFAGVNYQEAEPRAPMPDDDLAEIAALGNKAYERAVRFLRLTGCRLSELCQITWPDVDMDRGFVTVHKHKSRKRTHKSKVFVLVAEAVELLREVRRRQKPDYAGTVFLNNRNRPWNRRTLGQQLRRLKARHHLDTPGTLHCIRHQWGTRAVANGAPIKLVSQQLGHSSVVVTEKYYLHLAGEIDAIRHAAQFAMPEKPI